MTFTITAQDVFWMTLLAALGVAIYTVPWNRVGRWVMRRFEDRNTVEMDRENYEAIMDLIMLSTYGTSNLPVMTWIMKEIADRMDHGFRDRYQQATKEKFPTGQPHPLVSQNMPVSDIVSAMRKALEEV